MASDEETREKAAQGLADTLEAEEYQRGDRRVKRGDAATLLGVSEQLEARARVARDGDILARAQHVAPRRG